MQRTPVPICKMNLLLYERSCESIEQKIGNFWYTIKVDSTKDPTSVENISIVRLFNEHSLKVVERLLVLSSTDLGDVKSITDVIFAELRSILVPPHFQLVPHHFVCSGDGTEPPYNCKETNCYSVTR